MAATYINVPDTVGDEVATLEAEGRSVSSGWASSRVKSAAAGLVVLAIVGSLVAVVARPAHGTLRGKSLDAGGALALAAARDLMLIHKTRPSKDAAPETECAPLWGQCGGLGYEGPMCCDEGSECQHNTLVEYSSYHQCRRPEGPSCGGIEPGSQCEQMVDSLKWDVERTPENFKGLHPGMDDKEYQMYAHWGIWDESHCPEPCEEGGTCFAVLHIIGCDTLDTWYCSHDDGTLKYACCCKWFMEDQALDKPTDVDADMANAMEAVDSDSPSLFCTAILSPHGYELSLVQAQYAQGKLGLFACNDWSIYSNVSLRITPEWEKPEILTSLMKGSLSAEVGGSWGTALNTKVFVRFWDEVISDPKAWKSDWIVKVDPDSVWLPVRLRALLRTSHGPLGQPEPESGFWLNNCYLGLHGPIEVLSRKALGTYNTSKDECQHGEVSKIGQEDYFIRECFAKLGIQKVDAYNLLLESEFACGEHASSPDDKPPCFSPQVAFHPFKSISTWMRCHKQAANHPWALPAVPAVDAPSDANLFHA